MGQSKLKLQKPPAEPQPHPHDDDGLGAFDTEIQPERSAGELVPPEATFSNLRKYVGSAAGIVLIVTAATIAYVAMRPAGDQTTSTVSDPTTASALIDSRPPGASIFIDGIAQGATPMKLALRAGQHTLELKMEGAADRSFQLNIDGGTTVSHYVELAPSPQNPAASTGRLEVASDPSGAQVTVDGASKGRTPLTLADIRPGEHVVAIANGSDTINRSVSVAAGNTATVFVALGKAEAAAGWVTFRTPIELQIFEAKKLVGTTAAERLMLTAGPHELELVSTELEFRKTITLQVGARTTVTPAVDLPNGLLSINALPWAEVTLDGKPLGTTPLGNVAVPIGTYEIVWRHPQLGERRRTVKVPASTPVRAGVDLNP
jgi:hypothetical protein